MSIAGVCVDRGRVLRKEASVKRVEGTTAFVPVAEQWFRCRLFYEGGELVRDPQQARELGTPRPQVLTVTKDVDGIDLAFKGDDQFEIRSGELGQAVWQSSALPQPLRKKRRIIGWLLVVERVVEPMYNDLLQQDVPMVYTPLAGG